MTDNAWREVPVTWRIADKKSPRVCGYCIPLRTITGGEPYIVFGRSDRFVRCVDCARRMGHEPPTTITPPPAQPVPRPRSTNLPGVLPLTRTTSTDAQPDPPDLKTRALGGND